MNIIAVDTNNHVFTMGPFATYSAAADKAAELSAQIDSLVCILSNHEVGAGWVSGERIGLNAQRVTNAQCAALNMYLDLN